MRWTVGACGFVTAAACLSAGATTWETKTAGEYYNAAEIVARVHIIEAQSIRGHALSNGRPAGCGVRYVAEPVDILKGEVGETVVFYGYVGMDFENDFLVFLSRGQSENAKLSTNSMSLAQDQEILRACDGIVPSDALRASGFAESKIYWALNPVSHQMEYWAEPGWVTFPVGDFPERHEIQLGVIRFDGKAPPSVPGFLQYEKFPLPFAVWKFDGAVKWTEYREYILGSSKMDDRYKYPSGLIEPNLVDRDSETGKIVPKTKPYREVSAEH